MPLPVFPTTPKPDRVEPYGEEFPAIERTFDSVYSQVRQLTNRGLRRFALHYLNLTPQNRDELQRFFNLRKGKSERFDLTIPWLLMDDPGFEKGTATEWTLDSPSFSVSTASPRTGAKHLRLAPVALTTYYAISTQKIPLFPGDAIKISGYRKASALTSELGFFYIEFFNASDGLVAGGPSISFGFDTPWQLAASAAVTVPALVVYGLVKVKAVNIPIDGRTCVFDDLLVELTIPCRFDTTRLDWKFKPPSFWSVDIPFAEAP